MGERPISVKEREIIKVFGKNDVEANNIADLVVNAPQTKQQRDDLLKACKLMAKCLSFKTCDSCTVVPQCLVPPRIQGEEAIAEVEAK